MKIRNLIIIVIILITAHLPAYGIDEIDIDFKSNQNLLPYEVTTVLFSDNIGNRNIIYTPISVIQSSTKAADAYYLQAYNPALNFDGPAIIGYVKAEDLSIIDDNPIKMTLSDVKVKPTDNPDSSTVYSVGYRNDTAFVNYHLAGNDKIHSFFLTTGIDRSGNGAWQPFISINLITDYDYDGVDELFIYVNSSRDIYPRTLYCVDSKTMSIKWERPVSSLIRAQSFFSCRDSLNPSVIFIASNPAQGAKDDVYSDIYSYISKIGRNGEVLFNKIISRKHSRIQLIRGEHDSLYYFTNTLDFSDNNISNTLSDHLYLTKINKNMELIKQLEYSDVYTNLWIHKEENDKFLYAISLEGVFSKYDLSLNLIGKSKKTNLRRYTGEIRILKENTTALMFLTSDMRLDFYTHEFKKIASYENGCQFISPLIVNDMGGVIRFVGGHAGRKLIGEFNKKDTMAMVRVMMWQLRFYFIGILIILLISLIVMNALRQKNLNKLRRNEQRLRAIVDVSPDIMLRLDNHGILLDIQPFRIPGIFTQKENIIGKRLFDLLPQQAAANIKDKFELALSGIIQNIECEHEIIDKKIICNVQLVGSGKNEIIAFIRDISDHKESQLALAKSEQTLNSLFENVPGFVTILSTDYSMKFVNRVDEGYSMEDIIGAKVYNFILPEFRDNYIATLDKVVATQKPSTIDLMGVSAKNSTAWYSSRISPIIDNDEVVSLLVIATDITSITENRQALEESEARFKALAEESPVGVYIFQDNHVVYANSQLTVITGYTSEDLLKMPNPEEIIFTEDLEMFRNNIRMRLEGKVDNVNYNLRIYTKSGELKTFAIYGSKITYKGQPALMGCMLDITEKIKAEKALSESDQLNRAIIDNSPLGLSVRSNTGQLLLYNQSWCKIWRKTEENIQDDLNRKRDKLEFDETDSYLGNWQDEIARVYNQGGNLFVQEREIIRDDEIFWVSQHFYSLTNDQNQVERVVIITEDITDRIRTEREMKLLSQAVEQSMDGIAIAELNGHIRFANKSWADMHDLTVEECIGKNLKIFHSEKQMLKEVMPAVEIVIESGVYAGEIGHVKKDGTEFPTLMTTTLLKDSTGEPVGLIGIAKDITEIKNAQQELSISQARLSATLESTNDYILLSDNNAKPVYFNSAYAKKMHDLLAIDMEPGLQPHTLLPKKEERDLWESYHQRALNGEHFTVEFSFTAENEGLSYYEHTFNPIIENEKVVGFSEFTHDITQRKKAEDALKLSEEKFRSLAENTTAAIFIFDDDKFLYVNPMAVEITGYSFEEFEHLKFMNILTDETKDFVNHRNAIRRDGGEVTNTYEVAIHAKSGEVKWLIYTGIGITYSDQHAILGTAFEITDKKHAEAQLKKSENEKYNQTKQIAGGVAHEIYNSLFPATSTLHKLSQRLEMTDSNDIERNKSLTRLAESAVNRAIDLTEVVTEFSRLDTPKDIEILDLKESIVSIVNENPKIKNSSFEIKINIKRGLSFKMNRIHMYSLFYNLIDNAADAVLESEIHKINFTARRLNNNVELTIEDSGKGIPDEIQGEIFNPFYSTKPRTGTGLGLAISKRVIELYAGSIKVESCIDKGSKFIILIPAN